MHLHYTNTLPATFRCQRPFTNPPASCQQAACASQQPASIKYFKETDASDHKSKIAQPVSLVTNLKALLGDLDPAKLITQPGPMNAERLKDLITALTALDTPSIILAPPGALLAQPVKTITYVCSKWVNWAVHSQN